MFARSKILIEFMRYLGIDWGKARIGLAMADSETRLATPFRVVKNAEEVARTIKEEEVEKIIVGKPLTMAGEEGGMIKKVEKFILELKKVTDKPIEIIDERLSSRAADDLMRERSSGQERDAIAAMLILQSYLDQEKNE